MERRFDLVVLGTGAAASTVAHACRAAGWQVAIIDSQPFGGTCALRGCDSKKVLVGAAEAVDWARRIQARGFLGDGVGLDWPELMRFKRTFTDPVPKNREGAFAQAGITAFRGRARFVGPYGCRSQSAGVGDPLRRNRNLSKAAQAQYSGRAAHNHQR
jgi:glutathione reductase (NADPH)